MATADIEDTDTQDISMEIPVKTKSVSFVCDSEMLDEKLYRVDYTNKTQPLIGNCDKGKGNEQLNMPLGVALDHSTGNIYVADQINDCIKVFDSNARYLFKFGGKGEEMSSPRRLLIYENIILVTQYIQSIMIYQLDGQFVSEFGNGSGKLEFRNLYSLARDTSNGDIYICEYDNNRIQIISNQYEYKSEFGSKSLHQPIDIILHKDNIFILDTSNPCLHVFNRDLTLQRSIISRGKGKQVLTPSCVFIDRSNNILISDRSSNSIKIFNSTFHLIHKIPVHDFPTTVTMDDKDRLIVVCQADKNCLQIF